jgi:formylglycine-generating enzyme required for sulfatase activity/predicted Ser/Thr protein kinase
MNNFTHICPNCFADKQTAKQCPSCGYEETLTEQNPLYLKPRTLLNQRYLIGTVIGHGGFGITYMSWDCKLERKIAIKEFLPTALATRTSETSDGKTKYTVTAISEQAEAFKIGLKKFLKEAKILASFTHDNIVRVIDYFENYETGYIVMEYVGQEDLSQFIKRQSEKRLTVAQALEIFLPILNALKVIHANGIYHQDISLQNIRIVDGNKPVLIDFGAARYIVGEMSQSVEKVFKPGYSPLEQITTRGNIGPWTDIYACGAMFYAMIVGKLPPQSIDRLDQDDLIPPNQQIEISPALNDAVLKALSVRIGDRFQTAEEFETALKNPPKAKKKKRLLAVAGGVFLVVAIIVVGMIVVKTITRQPGTIFQDRLKDGSLGPQMVWIPAGTFQMGDIQGGGDADEQPVHQVSVAQFAMGRYEITFAEYDKFAQATGREKPDDRGWGRGNRPVIYVSWHDVKAYADWLTEQTGQNYRLPTEAEWEYAARAGTNTKYWWGNEIGANQANCINDYCKDNFEYTAPVGSFSPNPFGLHDTAGNVWEWTCSEYEDRYQGKEKRCVSDAGLFVLRGGSWDDIAWRTRAADRTRNVPANRNGGLGVRLARQ